MKKTFAILLFILCGVMSVFCQDGCSAPPEPQVAEALPQVATPLLIPSNSVPQAAEETLWKLVLISSRWDYDPELRKARVSGIVFNAGEERVRGAGLQATLRDGAGRNIGSAWKTTASVYLEARAYDTIVFEVFVPPGPEPATVILETISVTGSCGW